MLIKIINQIIFLLLFLFKKTSLAQSSDTLPPNLMDDPLIKSALSMTGINANQSMGVNIAVVLANVVFGLIGFVVFIRGKKQSEWRKMIIGIALMVYPFFTSNIWLVYMIGIACTLALFYWRD